MIFLDVPLSHKQVKDQILRILYDNRGGNTLFNAQKIAKMIRKEVGLDLKSKQIRNYLLELVDEGLVKAKCDAYRKEKTIPSSDRYYLSETGILYVENGYKEVGKPYIEELVESIEEIGGILKQLLNLSEVSVEEQIIQNKMLEELKKALSDKDDSKARTVLKQALDIGKQIAIPLMLEYIKGLAKW